MKLSRNRYFSTLVAEIRMGMVEMFSYNFSFFLDIAIMFDLLALFHQSVQHARKKGTLFFY